MQSDEFAAPHAVQFTGSRWARRLLRFMGWRVEFSGLPSLQGVAIVYPHTSNWDFLVLILAKWAIGVPASFWAKDSLFRFPVFGRWLRWLGGVPIDRSAAQGVVGQTAAHFLEAKRNHRYFWLALAPEGTRKRHPGWRSGFYRTALLADVPLALVRLDYRLREVRATHFIRLSGNEGPDMLRIAAAYEGVTGCRPEHAAPISLLTSVRSPQ